VLALGLCLNFVAFSHVFEICILIDVNFVHTRGATACRAFFLLEYVVTLSGSTGSCVSSAKFAELIALCFHTHAQMFSKHQNVALKHYERYVQRVADNARTGNISETKLASDTGQTREFVRYACVWIV
jgi:hypothetical protein